MLHFQGAISGRSRWSNLEKVCTSVNLNKACRKQEELGEWGGQGGVAVGRCSEPGLSALALQIPAWRP